MPYTLRRWMGATLLLTAAAANTNAQTLPENFTTGPLINDYGPVADVADRAPLPTNATFKVSFDVGTMADAGALNRSLVSAARFLNMHAKAGVAPQNLSLAVVIHGKAVHDMTRDAHYHPHTGHNNANADLIKTLLANGVSFAVCGQSAAYHGVESEDLLPGVTMALSAMTQHAILQQQGYTLNPF